MANCLRCGNEWTPRKVSPKRCPGCQNPNWNRPTKRKKRQPVVEMDREVLDATKEVIEGENLPPKAVEQVYSTLSDAKARAEELMRKLTI